MANFLKISHKILKEMDFSLKNSIFISKKSGKLIKMQQFNQIFNFLFFVPNFLQKIKKFIKSKKQKFFVFVGSHIYNFSHNKIPNVVINIESTWGSRMILQIFAHH